MNRDRPFLHHVVFCVEPTHQEEAAHWSTDFGFDLAVIELADVGLRILLDWTRGIEIITPQNQVSTEAGQLQPCRDPDARPRPSRIVETISDTFVVASVEDAP